MAEYDARPSKIKLKATPEEKAARIYRREQRRAHRQQVRIERANRRGARAGTPEPATATVSPPRRPVQLDDDAYGPVPPRPGDDDEDDAEAAYFASAANPFASYDDVPAHVPLRFAPAAHPPPRHAAAEVAFAGGPVPPLGSMTEAEYTEFIRAGIDALRAVRAGREDEARRAERRARDEQEWEEERERVRREEERAERRRARRARRADEERGQDREQDRGHERERWRGLEEDAGARRQDAAYRAGRIPTDAAALRGERARWRARAQALMLGAGDDDVVALELGWGDVPWPVQGRPRGPDDIDKVKVGEFVRALARDDAGDDGRALKKVLREAIRVYHPDRFYARVLPRISEDAREHVRQGVELCSRIINELAASQM